MNIVRSRDYEWPAPYKEATERFSPQVRLDAAGDLINYVAGLPFQTPDPNDPQVARKVMWNFQYGPSLTDDLDSRDAEIACYAPRRSGPYAVYPVGHLAVYRNIGRTEVEPVPTNHDGGSGIMERIAFGQINVPIVQPWWDRQSAWMVRFRYDNRRRSDSMYSGFTLYEWPHPDLSNADYYSSNAFFGNLDMDSLFGFSAKLQNWDFKFLGVKEMLASVHATTLPARSCAADGGRTICPEDWELRRVYVIEADAHKPSYLGDRPPIAKRILYIDSQGWFITASDQYDRQGSLWKTLAIFNTVRDREYPDSRASVFSFPRLFQTALVDEDVQDGYSTILFTPSPDRPHDDTWFINQGVISERWIIPQRFFDLRQYFY